MVKKRPAAGPAPKRPAKGVLDEAGGEFFRRKLPQLFEADSVLLRSLRRFEAVAGNRLLRERAARAFRQKDVFAFQFHAAREAGFRLAIAAYAHVARGDADDLAGVAEKKIGRGEAGVDFDAQAFRARAQPARDRAKGADEIAVVAHEPRHWPIRQAHASRLGQEIEA